MLIEPAYYINFPIDSNSNYNYKDILKEKNFNLDLVYQCVDFLETGADLLVYKATRSGFTTSMTAAAKLSGKKAMIITPTHSIRNGTIAKVPDINHESLLPNKFCLKLQKKFSEDPELEKLVYHLPSCKNCEVEYYCEFRKFLNSVDYDVVSCTYKKAEALALGETKLNKAILSKLNEEIDFILLDEAHILNLPNNEKINIDYQPHELFAKGKSLKRIVDFWNTLVRRIKGEYVQKTLDGGSFGSKFAELETKKLKGKSSQSLAVLDEIKADSTHKETRKAQGELLDLAEKRDGVLITEFEKMQTLISFYNNFSSRIIIQSIGDEVFLSTPDFGGLTRFLRKFPDKQIIITSATLYEKYNGFFDTLTGREPYSTEFEDVRFTDKKFKITPSKYRFDPKDERTFENMIKDAKEIIEAEGRDKDYYLVAMNSSLAKQIKLRLKKDGYDLDVDYYRSSSSTGVSNDARICLSFGLAEIPVNVFDGETAYIQDEEKRWLESRKMRYNAVLAATYQAWSRVKDPEGITESRVYALGTRISEASNVIKWSEDRKVLYKIQTKNIAGIDHRFVKFTVKAKDPIGLPTVLFERGATRKLERNILKPDDFIDCFITSYKHLNYQQGLEFERKRKDYKAEKFEEIPDKSPDGEDLFLFNQWTSEDERNWNYSVMDVLFFHRRTPVAVQNMDGKSYYKDEKVHLDKDNEIILDHLEGKITIGSYLIKGSDETVTAFCYDIDKHKPEDPDTEPKLRCLLTVLDRYGLEYLVESSGSPNSYHVWLFCYPENCLTVNKFGKVLMREAGIKCEFFPPQKRLSRDKPLGSLVKLPLGINRKNGNRSQFLNPETLEPIKGKVRLPKVIKFNEIPDERLTEEKVKFFRKYENHKMRPCFTKALSEGRSFTGFGGHRFRLALALEAHYSGLEVDEIIKLFEGQADFDESKTRYQIEHAIAAQYKPFQCATLQTDCSEFVNCTTCKLRTD